MVYIFYLFKIIFIDCEWLIFYFKFLFPINVVMSLLTQANALISHCRFSASSQGAKGQTLIFCGEWGGGGISNLYYLVGT